MKDTDFYNQILGLNPPWKVDKVSLDIEQQKVNVWVTHQKNHKWLCPKCQNQCPLHDHAPERVWRHLDTCQLHTFLHARIPRIHCQEHGVIQVDVPWSFPKSRFTLLMERFVIDVLTASATVSGRVKFCA